MQGIKRSISIIVAALLPCGAFAGDINPGVTFVDGSTYYAADFNNAFSNASINPSFISTQPVAGTIGASDLFVINQSGGLKGVPFSLIQSSVLANPNLTNPVLGGLVSITGVATGADNNQNNYALTASTTTLRITPTANRTYTGFAGGSSGRLLLIHNIATAFTITLSHNSASSSAANRIDASRDYIIQPQAVAALVYDSTSSLWRIVGERPTLNPSWVTLTDGATVTLTCDPNKGTQKNTVTIAGNRTLAFSGAVAGMSGVLKVVQGSGGSHTLALPAGSKVVGGGSGVITLSTAASSIDILCWEFDGTNYFWTYGKNFN